MNFSRRSLIQGAVGLAAAPALLRAGEAWAQTVAPTYLIEICLRDQVDFGHVMVAPGLATDANLRRGPSGRR